MLLNKTVCVCVFFPVNGWLLSAFVLHMALTLRVLLTEQAESALQLLCIVPAVSTPHINMSFFPPFKFMRAGAEFCNNPWNKSTRLCICGIVWNPAKPG